MEDAYVGTWVSTGFGVGSAIAVVNPVAGQYVLSPKATFGNNRLLFTWMGTSFRNDVTFAFGSYNPLAAGTTPAILGSGQDLWAAFNNNSHAFGTVWLDQDFSSQFWIKMRTFPNGCESLSCANVERIPV